MTEVSCNFFLRKAFIAAQLLYLFANHKFHSIILILSRRKFVTQIPEEKGKKRKLGMRCIFKY